MAAPSYTDDVKKGKTNANDIARWIEDDLKEYGRSHFA